MGHKVFRDAGTGQYVSREYAVENPETTVSEEISGELRKVVLVHPAGIITDYVPVEHLSEYLDQAIAGGNNPVHIGQGHDSGPGGDDQHYHEED